MCRRLFLPFLPRHRGRFRALERRVNQLEQIMSDTKSELLARLESLEAKVNQYTTDRGNEIAAAVAAAREAQKSEDQAAAQADLEAALAKIDEIGNGLVTFQASGN
jgi:hypothetical protein